MPNGMTKTIVSSGMTVSKRNIIGSSAEFFCVRPKMIGCATRTRLFHPAQTGLAGTGGVNISMATPTPRTQAGARTGKPLVCSERKAALVPEFGARVVVFRLRIDALTNRSYYGRDDEDEILIEGTVENIEISTGLEEEEKSV